jgi:hypothetical protein
VNNHLRYFRKCVLTGAYMADNKKKLQSKDRLLWSRVAEKSESNQVEFRRRIDLLDAAQSSVAPIWIAIDTKT